MKNIILLLVFVFVSSNIFSQGTLTTRQDSLFAFNKGSISEDLLIKLINNQLDSVLDSCVMIEYDDFLTIIYTSKRVSIVCIVNYDSPYQELMFVTLIGDKKTISSLSEIYKLEMWPTAVLGASLMSQQNACSSLEFFKGGGGD